MKEYNFYISYYLEEPYDNKVLRTGFFKFEDTEMPDYAQVKNKIRKINPSDRDGYPIITILGWSPLPY